MKKYLSAAMIGVLLLVVPLFLAGVIAPTGTGVLSDVQWWTGSTWQSVAKDGQGAFPVNPGETYRVIITNVEGSISSPTTVWIKGSYTNGDPWQIVLTNQPIVSDTITTDGFEIPTNAGCTAVVAYDEVSHMAAESEGSNKPGHLKTYSVTGQPIPCEGVSVPEFPAPEFPPGLEAIIPLCLLAACAIIRKKKQ